jgi:hypothetical protein
MRAPTSVGGKEHGDTAYLSYLQTIAERSPLDLVSNLYPKLLSLRGTSLAGWTLKWSVWTGWPFKVRGSRTGYQKGSTLNLVFALVVATVKSLTVKVSFRGGGTGINSKHKGVSIYIITSILQYLQVCVWSILNLLIPSCSSYRCYVGTYSYSLAIWLHSVDALTQ